MQNRIKSWLDHREEQAMLAAEAQRAMKVTRKSYRIGFEFAQSNEMKRLFGIDDAAVLPPSDYTVTYTEVIDPHSGIMRYTFVVTMVDGNHSVELKRPEPSELLNPKSFVTGMRRGFETLTAPLAGRMP